MVYILIINGYQFYFFVEGKLNVVLVEWVKVFFEKWGDEVWVVEIVKGYDMEIEVQNYVWVDIIIMQYLVNWMGVFWLFKKYQDDVYMVGMDGCLCVWDGWMVDVLKKNYGFGGSLGGKIYMLLLIFNVLCEVFDDDKEFLFQGRFVDDLMMLMYMNVWFFGLEKLLIFVVYDVMKNFEIESDFICFDVYLIDMFVKELFYGVV